MQSKLNRYASSLLKRKLWSEQEFRSKLERKFGKSDDVEYILENLISKGALNDTEYAKAYILSKNNVNPTGDYKKSLFLLKKGVAKTTIDQAISKYSIGDSETAKILTEKKLRKIQRATKSFNKQDIINKLMSNLSYHCIPTSTAWETVGEMPEELISDVVSANLRSE